MSNVIISNKDQIVMSLVHYFVTKEDYAPIQVQGAKDEVWLENLSAEYKIIRINTNYIHNNEQHDFDVIKVNHVLKQIKKKTLSFKLNALNICINVNDRVKVRDNKNVNTIKAFHLEEIEKNITIKKAFPTIELDLVKKTDNLDLILNVTEDINKKTEKNNKIFEKTFKKKTIIMTNIIIGICVVLYLIFSFSADPVVINFFNRHFVVNSYYVSTGSLYLLLTGAFMHGSFTHLLVNMYSLYIIGRQLENFVGKIKFLLIYLISALTGSLVTVVFGNNSVGASGAIFGLLGALLYFGYHYRLYLNDALKTQILPIIVINLLISLMIPQIDFAAHIGGLIGGYLVTAALGIEGKENKAESINSLIALLLLIAFLAYMILR